MNYYEANRILDRVRDGAQFSEDVILRALDLTGDYEGLRGEGVDCEVQGQAKTGWSSGRMDLVAGYPC